MGNLYYIRFKGLYTDDINKTGEWKRIEIQHGKSTYIRYTRDEIEKNLDKNFITIETISNKKITIATKFIIEIDTINIEYDKNQELGEKNWLYRDWKEEW